MTQKNFKCYIAIVSCLLIPVVRTESPQYLGSVDGKSFYIGNITLNWFDALNYCKSSGNPSHPMRLAAIRTVKETNLLIDSLIEKELTNFSMWTAGRQYISPGAFIWHNSNNQPHIDALMHWREFSEPYHYCVSFYKRAYPNGHDYAGVPCTNKHVPLCEE